MNLLTIDSYNLNVTTFSLKWVFNMLYDRKKTEAENKEQDKANKHNLTVLQMIAVTATIVVSGITIAKHIKK